VPETVKEQVLQYNLERSIYILRTAITKPEMQVVRRKYTGRQYTDY